MDSRFIQGSVAATISALIASTEAGDRSASDALFSALYSELHRIARRQLSDAGPRLTLGPTTLLHEAYLNMSQREGPAFPDRDRFMGYAARVMRNVVIDHVRRRGTRKRGGQFQITTLDDEAGAAIAGGEELVRVGEALEDLAGIDPPLADVVDLKFFCGFSVVEIARMRCVSERTVQRQWEKARAFLHRRIQETMR
ncbi:MAG TPA: ECF-type sigma factor [Thermoanaerobaculia bacterium]|nr:ECF-type sigma factor [Thermoanaerobaculia bacterium]